MGGQGGGDLHILNACRRRSRGVVIEQIVRLGDLHIRKQIQVSRCRLPMTVGSLVLHHHHERPLSRLPILEPVDGQISDDVGGVTLVPTLVEALL